MPSKMIREPYSGAWLWVGCVQFFVAEQVVRSVWTVPYSFATNYVSDLGATNCSAQLCSPWHALMNASFAVQGALIAGGALLTWRRWSSWARFGLALLVTCGLGVIVVAWVAENEQSELHRAGAVVHFLCGGLAMIAIGFNFRRGFGWISAAVGVLVLAALVTLGIPEGALTERLGIGSVERIAAYGIAGWVTALGLWSRWRRKA